MIAAWEATMDTRRCLTDVARCELEMLIRDTKAAIDGLDRQRESALQAIETAQAAKGCPSDLPEEADLLIMEMLGHVRHLGHMLDKTMREIERMELSQPSPGNQQLIPWPLWFNSPKEACRLVPAEEQR
jgi:hypothetical protein